ncbi:MULTISPECIES: hypothetical protein [unclassified Variovorax]|uniref:hypothetical protein n=1 Tax=unclassified Variovorax TaxID=663243 RepID=UPI0015A4F7FA|nr:MULTISPECIES: hypothetical protein [unclassified Variovorax]
MKRWMKASLVLVRAAAPWRVLALGGQEEEEQEQEAQEQEPEPEPQGWWEKRSRRRHSRRRTP